MQETQQTEWKTRSCKSPERRVWSMGNFPFQDGNDIWVTKERRRLVDRRGSGAEQAERPASVMAADDASSRRLAMLATALAVLAVIWSVTDKGVIASVADTVGIAL